MPLSAMTIVVTLPDGSKREYAAGTTIKAIALSIGKRLGHDAIGGVISEVGVIDVHTPLYTDCCLQIITLNSDAGLEVLRHSTAHVMASAVQRLYPGTQVSIGPAIDDGFYYDFKREHGFSPDDLLQIEEEMRRVIALDLPFVREEVSRDAAIKLFADLGEVFKIELIQRIPPNETITLYRHGDWVDLCRGPHLPRTGLIKAFKLTHVSGAYWLGDENKPMLARIYGTAFWDTKTLEAHFHMLEEAKKRDHRLLGKALDLFSFHPLAPAMPFFHARGTIVYNQLLQLMRNYYAAMGFDEVITPQVFDVALFKQSGHYANYRDDMFFCHIDEREFGVKPMNCPGHTLLYAGQKRSYRDLPIRMADFGRLHRYERSGATQGLTRVRSFCQDDAHIFCTEDQIGTEIELQILMIQDLYRHFGFEMKVGLSTRPRESLGREAELTDAERLEWDGIWHRAEAMLQQAIEKAGFAYDINAADGAFYGPKIDCQVRDALGRWFQLSTIQLDFGLPKRFDLAYTSASGAAMRPVMIHRAILGSIERFMGILLEHCAGDLPLWLAPCQVQVLTVGAQHAAYGERVLGMLQKAGVRAALDARYEKLGFKIRHAELQKMPVVWILGDKEQENGSVSVRLRKGDDLGSLSLDQALAVVLETAAVPKPSRDILNRQEQMLACVAKSKQEE